MSELQTVNQGNSMGIFNPDKFDQILKVAETLMRSDLVPEIYQAGSDSTKNNKARANVLIALNMAQRMQADPLMVMQNLHVVKCRPAWSAQFLIACFNTCGRFSAIQYKFSGEPGTDDYGCQAWALEHATSQKIEGTKITIGMAKKEKWWSKIDKYNNETSKWQSMPEQMFRYRAATFFIRATAPEIAMGLSTQEEVEDMRDVTPEAAPEKKKTFSKTRVHGAKEKPELIEVTAAAHNPETGEIKESEAEKKTAELDLAPSPEPAVERPWS